MNAIDPYYSSLSDHFWVYRIDASGKNINARWNINSSCMTAVAYWKASVSENKPIYIRLMLTAGTHFYLK